MYLGISEDVSRAKTNNSLKFRRAAPRLSAQMYLVLSKSGLVLGIFVSLASLVLFLYAGLAQRIMLD